MSLFFIHAFTSPHAILFDACQTKLSPKFDKYAIEQ